MNENKENNLQSSKTQSLFTQETPKKRKSPFFYVALFLALVVVLVLLYRSFASTPEEDTIKSTLAINDIGQDFDGTSDGTYNLTIVGGGGNTRHWDGSDSADWHVAANWAENLVPSACSTVIIDGDVENFIGSALDYYDPILDLSGGSEGIANLYLGTLYEADPDSTPTTLEVSYGSETNKLVVTGDVIIGDADSSNINGTLTHTANNTTQTHVLNMDVGGNVTVDVGGSIDVTGKGYNGAYNPDGLFGYDLHSSHGGVGSGGTIPAYGSITEPFEIGSGATAHNYNSNKGGGVVKIKANAIQTDGNILANGKYNAVLYGSAGGSIWLDTNQLSGNGDIASMGNLYAGTQSQYGGGGRIAVYYTDDNVFADVNPTFTGNIYTTNPTPILNGYNVGGAGTIYLKDKDNASDYGTLIIDSHKTANLAEKTPQWTEDMDISNKEMTYSKIDIRSGGFYEVPEGATLNILDTTVNSGDNLGELRNSGTVNFPADYTFANSFTFNQDAKNGTTTGLTGTLTIDNGILSTFNTTGDTGVLAEHAWILPGNLSVINGGIVTHTINPLYSNDQNNSLNLNVAGNLTVDATSKIDVTGKGYNNYYSGAGRGPGRSIYANDYAVHAGVRYSIYNYNDNIYGSITEPIDLGSASYAAYNAYARGGGAVKLFIGGDAEIQGRILANEYKTGNSIFSPGGSIWLNIDGAFTGSATTLISSSSELSANGNSGGRTAIYYGSLNFGTAILEDQVESYGGILNTNANAGAGTIYIKNKTTGEDELIIDNGGFVTASKESYTSQYGGTMPEEFKEMTYSKIILRNGGVYQIPNNATLNILSTTVNSGDKTGELRNSGTVNFPADYTFSDSFTFNQDAKNGTTTGLTGTLTIDNSGLSTFNTGDVEDLGETGSQYAFNLLGNLRLINGSIASHNVNNDKQINTLSLNINGDFELDVSSNINVNGAGYYRDGPGGGYGAHGGYGWYSIYGNPGIAQGIIYDSIKQPVLLGSGAQYDSGGGAIKIISGGTMIIDGNISANRGRDGYDPYKGGAGGSVYLDANTIEGDGSVDANGGEHTVGPWFSITHSGGGGRIAVYYNEYDDSTNTILENLSTSVSGNRGGAGTIYVKDKDNSLDLGTLIIDGEGYTGADRLSTPQQADLMSTDTQDFTVSTLEIKGGGKYEVGSDDILHLPTTINILGDATGGVINRGLTIFTDGNTTIDSSIDVYNYAILQGLSDLTMTGGSDLYHSAIGSLGTLSNLTIGNNSIVELQDYDLTSPLVLGNLTIENGGTLTHKGNTTSQDNIINLLVDNLDIEAGGAINVSSKGYKTESGPGAATANYSGGSYGGTGGGTTPGATYGSETNPVDLGSGGDYYSDFISSSNFGGGMVRAQITNTLTVDGEIHADGSDNNYGASSGGTVFLSTNNFKGTGFITADGGTDSGVEDGGGGRIAVYYQDTNISGDHFLLPGNGSITHLDANPITMTDNDPVGGDDPTNLTKQGTLYIGYPDHYEITGNNTQVAGTSQNIGVTLIDNNGNPFIITDSKDFTFSGANPSPNGTEPTIEDKNNNPIVLGNVTPLNLINGTVFTDMILYKTEDAEIETTDGFYNTFGDQSYDLDVTVTESTPDETQTTIDTLVNPLPAGNNVDVVVTPKDLYGNPVTVTGATVALNIAGANAIGALATTEVVDGGTGLVTYIANYLATNVGVDQITGTINSSTITNDEDGTSDGTYNQLLTGAGAGHLEITISGDNGALTPVAMVAGAPQTITITAKDSGGNVDLAYTGLKNITITGTNNAPDGTKPTTRDNGGIDVSMTESPSLVTQLNFVNGVATSQMYLYKQEIAEIEATDGSISTFGDQSYDLDVDVSNSGIDYIQSLLEVNKSVVEPGEEVIITVILRDEFQNQLTVGGETVTASVAGTNPEGPINLNDNGDGTYSTTSGTHHVPTAFGNDQVTATVSGNVVTHDNDGTDDGTFNLLITTLPRHIEITGNNTQVAGTSQTITLTVKNSVGTIDDTYDGTKTITFSGASISGQGDNPTVDGVNFSIVTNINFTDGVATADMILFAVETAEIEATDGSISTFGDQSYDLDVDVIVSSACLGDLFAVPNPVVVNNQVDISLDNITDQYGNPITTGNGNPSLNITGANSVNLSVVDNGDGTYSSDYSPNNIGTDVLGGTLGVCSLNSVNIDVVSDEDPVCGSNAKIYNSDDTSYSGSFCQIGTADPSTPNFPNVGDSISWNCEKNGKTVTCNAIREDDNNREVDLYNIKNEDCSSLDLRVELKNFPDDDKFDFKIYVKNLETGEKFKLKTDSVSVSDDNKVTLHISDLDENINYEFKVAASEEGDSDYTESNKKDSETLNCQKIFTDEASCGSNAKTYLSEEDKFIGEFCQRGEVDSIPSFPRKDSLVSWTCKYKLSSVNCNAKREGDMVEGLVCGDLKAEGEEECDDGNTNNGDGCDSSCKIEKSVTTSDIPVCGEAAQLYKYTESQFEGYLCQVGVVVGKPSFPNIGESASWSCEKDGNSVSCNSRREEELQVVEKIEEPKELDNVDEIQDDKKLNLPLLPWLSVLGLFAAGLLLIPFRTTPALSFIELFGLVTKRSKDVSWGTVFEYETKMPIVAAKVTLMDTLGMELETVYSDKYGRYGFLAGAGTYIMDIYKEDHTLITNKNKDSVYSGDLYTNQPFTIKEDEVVIKNIAMKSDKIDWKEYANKRIKAYTSKFRIFKEYFLTFIHITCFVYTAIVTFLFPNMWNIVMLVAYIVLFIIQLIIKKRNYGIVTTVDKKPVPFSIINLYSKLSNKKEAFAISNVIGRYYLLAENGDYNITVKGQPASGNIFEKKGEIRVTKGLVKKKIRV